MKEIIETSETTIQLSALQGYKVMDNPEILIKELRNFGYTVIGPTVKNQTIALDVIESADELPKSYTDEQEKAFYNIKKNGSDAYFNYTATPNSWKQFLFPPKSHLFNAVKNYREVKLEYKNNNIPKYAFFGVKACELAAIKIQDKVFIDGTYKDTYYQKTRENALIIAVHCSKSGNTCFCDSMGTGPEIKEGYDILMSEIVKEDSHYFVIRAGSKRGSDIISKFESKEPDENDITLMIMNLEEVSKTQKRAIDNSGVKELLYNNYEHPRFDDVAKRCFTCANCTLVCPTCFCSTMEDTTDLKGELGQRWKKWDSCFSLAYSKVAGGNFRPSPKARYRQWLTHKFAYWKDQFGTSGCVGCGRCITWCPSKIDVTEEINEIAKEPLIQTSNNT